MRRRATHGLAAQAEIEHLTLPTDDRVMAVHGRPIVWA